MGTHQFIADRSLSIKWDVTDKMILDSRNWLFKFIVYL